MAKYIMGRLLVVIPMLLGASVIVFVMMRFGGADPALNYLRLSQVPPSEEALAHARQMLGLDRPLLVQYLDWLWKALHLDFGLSYVSRKPVMQEFLSFLPASIKLGSTAFLFIMAVSIPLGVQSAVHRDRWPDHLGRFISLLGVSTPTFWLGFILIYVFAVWLKWLPPFGRQDWRSYIMPVFTMSFMSLAVNSRLLRSSMLEAKGQRYVLWAAMRGLPQTYITRHHVLRNAMLPILTVSGMYLAQLIGWSMMVETVFAWPGVGRWLVASINNRDYPVLQCFTLVMTTFFVLINLLNDILYAWVDPSIRYSGSDKGVS
ncbi:MAG: nickel ABC transporter permease subunit NikB [Brachymonas sp.]|nr:nickel ABC transporter permease subunit NikB [Brachymonas sp.]